MDDFASDLSQGRQDEASLVEAWVRDGQLRTVHRDLAEEQQVEVDRPGAQGFSSSPPEQRFGRQQEFEKLDRLERRVKADRGIQVRGLIGRSTDGVGFIKRGYAVEPQGLMGGEVHHRSSYGVEAVAQVRSDSDECENSYGVREFLARAASGGPVKRNTVHSFIGTAPRLW